MSLGYFKSSITSSETIFEPQRGKFVYSSYSTGFLSNNRILMRFEIGIDQSEDVEVFLSFDNNLNIPKIDVKIDGLP